MNAALIAVVVSADVVGYQTARAGVALHQWWLAPLGWRLIAGHPARQVLLGVPVLFVLALTWLASSTWRYEAVRPPYRVSPSRENTIRKVTAAALPGGVADDEFWDGEGSVRLATWLHVAVTGGFLAIVLGVTVRALSAGAPHAVLAGWAGIGLGAATVVLGAGYVVLDALATPPMDTPGTPRSRADQAAGPTLADRLGGLMTYLPGGAAAALVLAGLFAWLQPAAGFGRVAGLPGMASVVRCTALAIAAALIIGLVSMLLGLPGGKDTFKGAPWVTLMLGFGLLNIVLLGAVIWVAHMVGAVTTDAAAAVNQGQIYLPYLVTAGAPLVAWAAVLAIVSWVLAEAGRWLFTGQLPAATAAAYRTQAAKFRGEQTGLRRYWYWSGHPALITFGSPLIKLYGWGFPAYFGAGLLGPLVPGEAGRLSNWHNLHYPTDPIGGPTVGEPTDLGLLDPAECYYVYGQTPPSAQGHSGYWADPRVWAVINRVAAGLDDAGLSNAGPAVGNGLAVVPAQAQSDNSGNQAPHGLMFIKRGTVCLRSKCDAHSGNAHRYGRTVGGNVYMSSRHDKRALTSLIRSCRADPAKP